MKAHNSSENTRLYNESRRRVKTLIKRTKRRYEENIAAESNYNAKMFFKCINNNKNIRSGIGPLSYSYGNMVTDDQSMASMLNKYFSSVFNTTSGADTSNTYGNNTNYVTSSASVDRQDAMTQHSNNSNVSASNNTEYPHVPDQQNCVHDHVISSEHTLQKP